MTPSLDVVLMVAGPGFGKSTALDAARHRDGVIVTGRTALEGLPDRDWVGVDDLHLLTAHEQQRLIAQISVLGRTTRVVLTSRQPLTREVRRLLRGRVRELGPEDLALDPYAVRRVLVDEYGVLDPEAPVDVHALTAGWPSLVHFAADVLTRHPDADLRSALTKQGAPAAAWLREEVLPVVGPGSRHLLACLSGLGPLSPDVCGNVAEALDLGSGEWSIADLEAAGIFTPLHGLGRDGLLEIVPAVADVLAANVEPPVSQTGLRAAAHGLEQAGLPFGAAVASARLGDWAGALRLVADQGEKMLRRGDAAGVVDLVRSAPAGELPGAVQLIYADALRICGDLSGAARAFRPLIDAADGAEGAPGQGWSPALASRVAAVHYAGGRLETALQVLSRADVPAATVTRDAGDDVETVEWMASRVHHLCSLGRHDEAGPLAGDVLERAEASGDARALTASHMAMARASQGESKQAHHEYALSAATDSGDIITASRILVNQSFHLLATVRYVEASLVARSALRAADIGIATGRRSAALHNLAEALMQQGEYDEASWHLERAIALCRHLGVGRIALGLLGLAEIHRQLGHDERARARYLEAVDLARGSGEMQVLVPALAGLARLYAVGREHPASLFDEAQAAADEALRVANGQVQPVALTAAGWAALRGDDRTRASELARQSVAAAREMQALDLLADALELAGACADDPGDARQKLTEALAIWDDGGAGPPARKIELQLGWLEGADTMQRSRARDAARELQRLGVRHVNGRPVTTTGSGASVAIAVLGGFSVSVDDTEVPLPAWRSRQARTLVKMLAARRGRPASRDWLCETLWPDDDPAKTGHRLAVLLATVRGVLDPERRWPTDHFISADRSGVRLDLRHVTLDLDTLISDADHAARMVDTDEPTRAAEILADIDARYRGDAFEDELGEEWADAVREEVRAAWQRSVRRLAILRRRAGRVSDAQTLQVRLLAADPYDESTHRQLVQGLLGAGRHGDARRAFARWRAAMREIGGPPPDQAILAWRPGNARTPGLSAARSLARSRPAF